MSTRNERRLQFKALSREQTARKRGAEAGPCDWPGCSTPWVYVTLGDHNGKYKPVIARRCLAHRIG